MSKELYEKYIFDNNLHKLTELFKKYENYALYYEDMMKQAFSNNREACLNLIFKKHKSYLKEIKNKEDFNKLLTRTITDKDLIDAAKNDNLEIFKYIYNQDYFHFWSKYDDATKIAIKNNSKEVIKFCLEKKLITNIYDTNYETFIYIQELLPINSILSIIDKTESIDIINYIFEKTKVNSELFFICIAKYYKLDKLNHLIHLLYDKDIFVIDTKWFVYQDTKIKFLFSIDFSIIEKYHIIKLTKKYPDFAFKLIELALEYKYNDILKMLHEHQLC